MGNLWSNTERIYLQENLYNLYSKISLVQTVRSFFYRRLKTILWSSTAVLASRLSPFWEVDSDNVNEPLQAAVKKTIGLWRQGIESFIEGGINKGEFPKQTDASKTSQLLICLVEGGFAMSKVTREQSYIENTLSHMEKVIRAL